MNRASTTAVDRHLGWLVMQVFLVPAAVGQSTIEEWAYEGLPLRLLDLSIAGLVGFFIVRNLVRLWRAPSSEASRRTAAPLLVLAALFLLVATGPLLASHHDSTKPMGISVLLVGAALAFLGLRDVARIRARRPVTTGG